MPSNTKRSPRSRASEERAEPTWRAALRARIRGAVWLGFIVGTGALLMLSIAEGGAPSMAFLAWGPDSGSEVASARATAPVPVVRSFTKTPLHREALEAPLKSEPVITNASGVPAEPPAVPAVPPPWTLPSNAIDPTLAETRDGRLVQTLSTGEEIEFTLEPDLQATAKMELSRYGVEHGSIVAMDPVTGELIAYAEHAEGKPNLRHLAVQANGPAASIFKMVTATALLENGLSPTSEICTRGGLRKLSLGHLRPDAARDTRCETLKEAFGASTNAAFARWSDQLLDAPKLNEVANRYLFGRRIPFVYGVGVSAPVIPKGSRLGFAKAAAGFSRTSMSPLHAAMMAGAVANGGKMMAPRLVRRATRGDEVLYEAATAELASVMSAETASALTDVMLSTTTTGTAKKFFIKNGREKIRGVSFAAKTGHLSGGEGLHGHYSWFVAFAPAEEPEVAVAALVVNGEVWTTKGAVLAQRFLASYFNDKRRAAQ
ncbi:MAG: penicillin-binding transpeptidase domain-containing protein [Myxococcota bacterium]